MIELPEFYLVRFKEFEYQNKHLRSIFKDSEKWQRYIKANVFYADPKDHEKHRDIYYIKQRPYEDIGIYVDKAVMDIIKGVDFKKKYVYNLREMLNGKSQI